MTDVPAVRNNTALSRFELETGAGTAVVLYRAAPGILTLYHTEVPRALRGQGIASRLLHGALEQIRSDGLKAVPACGFVRQYLATHPEFDEVRG